LNALQFDTKKDFDSSVFAKTLKIKYAFGNHWKSGLQKNPFYC